MLKFNIIDTFSTADPEWANALCNYNAHFAAEQISERLAIARARGHKYNDDGIITITAGCRKTIDISGIKCHIVKRVVKEVNERWPSEIIE